jgi:hypothetical protein
MSEREKQDWGRPTSDLFEELALDVVVRMSEGLLYELERMLRRTNGRFRRSRGEQLAASRLAGLQATIITVCSYAQSEFEGLGLEELSDRMRQTWDEMRRGHMLAEESERQGREAQKAGLS